MATNHPAGYAALTRPTTTHDHPPHRLIMSDSRRAALRAALQPASIAVVGASENPDKIGGRPLFYLSKFRYQGKVYPINPNRSKAQGYKAYPSLAALPDAPEV